MPKKSARPEMSWIESRKQWRKRVTIDGRSRDVYGKTKDEVRERIKEMERQVDAGLVLDDSTTLVQFMREWYEIKAAGLKPKSAEVYSIAINRHIAPFFGNMRIRDIRPLHVEKLMAKSAELSRSSQSKILFSLSQALDSAVKNGLLDKNPCTGIRPGGEAAKPKRPLDKQEQMDLVGAVKGTRAELFVLLCLYAGLRREEALGLLWGNVYLDTDTPYIDVRHTVTYDTSGRPAHAEALKTSAARRSIPVPTVLSTALKAARSVAGSMLVIPAVTTGGAMSQSSFRCMWDIVARAAPFHVEPHILRHTYITDLCAAGLDIKKIQYLAGHEDVTMTLKIYTHVRDNRPEELSAAIINIFAGAESGSGSASGSREIL